MANYDFRGLTSRYFEQLIQALAVKVIGPGVVPFGDGPDGGRDATFEGNFPYPSATDCWDGYGVIQAKFLQRPRDVGHDGEWVVSQLKSELEAYCDAKSNRRLPEYFVLATNVALTAVSGRGSKDRVVAVFKDFENRLPLKGFAVWDYDQLRVFLDNNEDVRNENTPWITPGDVFAKVMQMLDADTLDLEDTLGNFLQKEMIREQYVNLGQAGHDGSERIPLAQVFVDLPVKEERQNPKTRDSDGETKHYYMNDTTEQECRGFIKEILDVSAERLDPHSLAVRSIGASVGSEAFASSRGKIVLIGGPGEGKTTVGQFICQIFRAAIISRRPKQLLSYETRTALDAIQTNCHNEGIDLSIVPRFPFRIVLSEFASALSSTSSPDVNSVFSYLAQQIYRRTDRQVSSGDVVDWIARYPSVIVFDGLDEVPSTSNRDQVLDSIQDFWVDATSRKRRYSFNSHKSTTRLWRSLFS